MNIFEQFEVVCIGLGWLFMVAGVIQINAVESGD